MLYSIYHEAIPFKPISSSPNDDRLSIYKKNKGDQLSFRVSEIMINIPFPYDFPCLVLPFPFWIHFCVYSIPNQGNMAIKVEKNSKEEII